jgi:hypothetical protein
MKTFRIDEEGVGQVEYCVLKCPGCASVFRHDLGANSFGKPIKNRMCLVCGQKVPIDDKHCLNFDPMRGCFDAVFKPADKI